MCNEHAGDVIFGVDEIMEEVVGHAVYALVNEDEFEIACVCQNDCKK